MRRLKQGAATRMHSGRLDPVGLTINFKMTPSRFNHFQEIFIEDILERHTLKCIARFIIRNMNATEI